MHFHEMETLMFSFKNILKIDNLEGLTNLTKVQLDNNIIEKIENLDHLVNLTWLDLSFNNISKIEGLDSLTKLTDLSLLNNRIEVIENLDTLLDLNVLSIGNNAISNLENVMYLRKFPKLRLVNLAGNPICKDPEYRPYVLSRIKKLKYLDYRLVDGDAVNTAREQYQDELMEVEEREEKQEEERKHREVAEATGKKMAEANLAGVDTLFEDMLKADPEYPKLKQVPTLLDSLADFKDKFGQATEDFKTKVLEYHELKQAEIKDWKAAVDSHTNEKDGKGRDLIMRFEKMKKHVFRDIREDPGTTEFKITPLRDSNDDLQDQLLELETQTVTILTELNSIFDRNYSELVGTNKQHYNAYFTQIRDLENSFFEAVTVQSMQLIENYNSGELELEMEDDAMSLLQDKDTLLNSVQGMHDSHTSMIDGMEDKLVTAETRNADEKAALNVQWERKRNRSRISEISGLHSRNKAEMEDIAMASSIHPEM